MHPLRTPLPGLGKPTFHISDAPVAAEHHALHGAHAGSVFRFPHCSDRFRLRSVVEMNYYKYDLPPLAHDSYLHAVVFAGEDVGSATKSVNDALTAGVCYYADYSGHCYAAELDDVECEADYYYWPAVDDVVDDNADYEYCSVGAIVAIAETAAVAVADRDVAWCSRPFETDVLG